MFTFLQHILSRFFFAVYGVYFALRTDFSFRGQFILWAVVLGVFIYFAQPLTQAEYIFLGLAWVLILITELQNTAMETALDHLHPELHDAIGRTKDMAAGAVLLSGLFLAFVMAMVWLL